MTLLRQRFSRSSGELQEERQTETEDKKPTAAERKSESDLERVSRIIDERLNEIRRTEDPDFRSTLGDLTLGSHRYCYLKPEHKECVRRELVTVQAHLSEIDRLAGQYKFADDPEKTQYHLLRYALDQRLKQLPERFSPPDYADDQKRSDLRYRRELLTREVSEISRHLDDRPQEHQRPEQQEKPQHAPQKSQQEKQAHQTPQQENQTDSKKPKP